MKEKLPMIAGGLLGFAFVFFSINFFLNILAFNLFLVPGISGLFQPPVVLISLLSAYLLWVGREKFLALRN